MKTLLKEGYYQVSRTAGSHGLFDVHAFNRRHHLLIQVKYTKRSVRARSAWEDDNVKLFRKLKVPPRTHKMVWIYVHGNVTPRRIIL